MKTWKDVLEFLQKLSEDQLNQTAMLMPPEPDQTKSVHLEPIVAMGTVAYMCSSLDDDEVTTQTRGSDDFQHHPEQVIMLYDYSPYDEDGNTCYELVEGGFIGNVTGKLYPHPPGDEPGEDDDE